VLFNQENVFGIRRAKNKIQLAFVIRGLFIGEFVYLAHWHNDNFLVKMNLILVFMVQKDGTAENKENLY